MRSGSGSIVVCVGGADVDRKFHLAAPVAPGAASLTGRAVVGFGGVARNVAHTLTRLGVGAGLYALAGDDDDGAALVRDLQRSGIDMRGVSRVAGATTAQYVAVIGTDGGLVLEIADMAIVERFHPDALRAARAQLAEAAWVFAEANLRTDVIAALAARRYGGTYRFAVDAVAVPKAPRLPARLDGIDLAFFNEAEAAAYARAHGAEALAGTACAAALRARGAAAVVLTRGAQGAIVADGAGIVTVPAAPAARVVDVTGAGDALVATTLAGLLAGDTLHDAVRAGMRAAALTVATDATVRDDLTLASLRR